jgi:hypothetical protein
MTFSYSDTLNRVLIDDILAKVKIKWWRKLGFRN